MQATGAVDDLYVATAGLTAAQWERYDFGWSDISLFATDGPRLAQLELRIASPPRLLAEPFRQR